MLKIHHLPTHPLALGLFSNTMSSNATAPNTNPYTANKRTRSISRTHQILILCAIGIVAIFNHRIVYVFQPIDKKSAQNKNSPCSSWMKGRGVPTFKTRFGLPKLLDKEEGFHRGIELGVQEGKFSYWTLMHWTNCTEYHLVDLWGHQENYEDVANVDQASQEKIYQLAMRDLEEYKDKIHVCRNYTSVCVNNYEDEYFDYIYVDARHDFKGVWEDLVAYWPKLKVGGIMAGHDYVTNDDGPLASKQDWSKNYDGTIDETGTVVKGAVDKFAAEVCRQITVSYREAGWNTWAIRK